MLIFLRSMYGNYGPMTSSRFIEDSLLVDKNKNSCLIYIKNISNDSVTLDQITCKSNLNYRIRLLTNQERLSAEADQNFVDSLSYTLNDLDVNTTISSQGSVALALKYFDTDFNKIKNKLLLEVQYL